MSYREQKPVNLRLAKCATKRAKDCNGRGLMRALRPCLNDAGRYHLVGDSLGTSCKAKDHTSSHP